MAGIDSWEEMDSVVRVEVAYAQVVEADVMGVAEDTGGNVDMDESRGTLRHRNSSLGLVDVDCKRAVAEQASVWEGVEQCFPSWSIS